MQYQIEMLNVEDADAFVIYYKDANGDRLVLVDCGRYSDGQKVLRHIKRYYGNRYVDLAIVTHPDEDHYGGFAYLLEQQKLCNFAGIEDFWINVPGNNHIDADDVKGNQSQATVNKKANEIYDVKNNDGKIVNLIKIIDNENIERHERFSNYANQKEFNKFPYFHILGPTKEFFEKQVPNFRNDSIKFKKFSESLEQVQESWTDGTGVDTEPDDNSAHNESSIVFSFTPSGTDKKYLFMGDANEDAWNNIGETFPKRREQYAKNVHWLKVPHHGSDHNLSRNMIDFIRPKVAFISTKKIGKYLSQNTVNDLSEIGCEVYSTHKDGSDFIHNKFDGRDNYSPAIPFNKDKLEKQSGDSE